MSSAPAPATHAPIEPLKPANPEPTPQPDDPESGTVEVPEPGRPEHPAV